MVAAFRRVQANGVDFAYLSEGRGPLVLLLHGFPDTPHTWDRTRAFLAARGFRAVSPYLRGYAPSSVAPDGRYDTETLGRDVLSLIRALGEKSAIVMGHDWGGAAAYAAAQIDSGMVRQLVTVGVPHHGHIKPSLRLAWGIRHFGRLRLPNAENLLRPRDRRYVMKLIRRWSPTWNVTENDFEATWECFSDSESRQAAVAYYAQAWLPTEVLKRTISVPTVAFYGNDDPVLGRADFEFARRGFSGAYEILQIGGGHFAHREDPVGFERGILENVLVGGASRDESRTS